MLRHKREREQTKPIDVEFAESTYRAMLSDSNHEIVVTVDPKWRDASPNTRMLLPQRQSAYLSYAMRCDDGTYCTKYAKTAYNLTSHDGVEKSYRFNQDSERMQLFQVLGKASDAGTLLFESDIPYSVTPVLMIEHGDDIILCLNAVSHITSTVHDGKAKSSVDDATMMPLHAGYMYVIRLSVMSGQWKPLFESERPIKYSALPVMNDDGVAGILVANACNGGKSAMDLPTRFSDIPKYVTEQAPHEGQPINVPFGISVYVPKDGTFTVIPQGGMPKWHIMDVDIRACKSCNDEGNSDGDDKAVTNYLSYRYASPSDDAQNAC